MWNSLLFITAAALFLSSLLLSSTTATNNVAFAFQSPTVFATTRPNGMYGTVRRTPFGPTGSDSLLVAVRQEHPSSSSSSCCFLASLSLSKKNNMHDRHGRTTWQLGVADVAGIPPADERPSSDMSRKDNEEKTTTTTTTTTKQQQQRIPFPLVLWRFTRPHTLIGSAMAIPALHILAAPTFRQAFSIPAAISTLFAMVPSLLMNLYITGLNQITDVEIDKINKPQLPIAAGDLSLGTANVIVILSLLVSLAMGVASPTLGSQGLNVALWGSGILGTLYSLPPFRLKRFPILAAFCIVAVRGAVINAGFFAHALTAAYGVETTVLDCLRNNVRCFLSSLFFAVFGIVIALMKDVPDAVGDAKFNIRSFTVRIGQTKVFTAMRRLLTALFFGVGLGFSRLAIIPGAVGEMAVPSSSSMLILRCCRMIVALCAFGAGFSVRKEAQNVNAEDSGEVYNYYMHLWKLFYASYLVLPFAR